MCFHMLVFFCFIGQITFMYAEHLHFAMSPTTCSDGIVSLHLGHAAVFCSLVVFACLPIPCDHATGDILRIAPEDVF